MKKEPMLAISAEELDRMSKLEKVHMGDSIVCPRCKKKHILDAGKDASGEKNEFLLFYTCGSKTFLYAMCNAPLTFNTPKSKKTK